MENAIPPPEGLKHRPIYMVQYKPFDGPYANNSDCLFLSLGWAQYDPRSVSLKTWRHTGEKWSRQSEEIPPHRAIDLVIVLVRAIRHMIGVHLGTVDFPAGTFENQSHGQLVHAGATSVAEGENFGRQITSDLVRRRLRKLRDELNELHDADEL